MYNRGQDVREVLGYVNGVLFVEGPSVNGEKVVEVPEDVHIGSGL